MEDLEIVKLRKTDIERFVELLTLFEEVFEMKNFVMPAVGYLQQLLNRDDFFVFVALSDNRIIGGLTSHTLPSYYFEASEVYIYDLAVQNQFQRKGVGKGLITFIKNYCKQLGIREIFVQADQVDQYAIDFYHATGGIEERVVHFDYPLYDRS